MNRCTEIMNNLLGADTAQNILSCVELSQEIPIKIGEEKGMQVSQLYSLKPKFHLKALTFLRDKGIFCGEALGQFALFTGSKPLLKQNWNLKRNNLEGRERRQTRV